MLSNSQPLVNSLVRSELKSQNASKCKPWAALNVKAVGHVKARRPPLGLRIEKGSCGLNNVTAPVDPVPPRMPLTSSRDLPQVYPACNDGPPCPTFPDKEVCKAFVRRVRRPLSAQNSNPKPPRRRSASVEVRKPRKLRIRSGDTRLDRNILGSRKRRCSNIPNIRREAAEKPVPNPQRPKFAGSHCRSAGRSRTDSAARADDLGASAAKSCWYRFTSHHRVRRDFFRIAAGQHVSRPVVFINLRQFVSV